MDNLLRGLSEFFKVLDRYDQSIDCNIGLNLTQKPLGFLVKFTNTSLHSLPKVLIVRTMVLYFY
ncbi:hypothetical protein C0149_01920 [Moraxella catarrhalis]|nr:hypothetical protein [Moraxella catarrhalis]